MFWWKESSLLKKQLQSVQSELESEQGKATRLAGFLSRLQSFGGSADGRFSERNLAESALDAVHALLQADQVVFLQRNPDTLDFHPTAARGIAPQMLQKFHVPSEDAVRAALPRGSLLQPMVGQGQILGVIGVAAREGKTFSPDDRSTLALIAAECALLLSLEMIQKDLEGWREHTIQSLMRALSAKDAVTHRHSQRTRALVRAITQELSLPEALIQQIEDGAVLHDIGKVGIADAILKKPAELTAEEWDIMRTHAKLGQRILEPYPSLHTVGAIVLYHQEWYNGTGYPEGLAGEEIPLGARVVQVLDAWDAMTSDRPYRKAITRAQAIAELRRQAGSQFDPKLVEIFLRVIERLEREGIATTEVPEPRPAVARKA